MLFLDLGLLGLALALTLTLTLALTLILTLVSLGLLSLVLALGLILALGLGQSLRDRVIDHVSCIRLKKTTPIGLRFNQAGQTLVSLGILGLALAIGHCLLYTSPSPRDRTRSRMPSSA